MAKNYYYNGVLYHHGIKGQKWGVRRFQNEDRTWTAAGKERYGKKNNARIDAKQTTTSQKTHSDTVKKTTTSQKTHSDTVKKTRDDVEDSISKYDKAANNARNQIALQKYGKSIEQLRDESKSEQEEHRRLLRNYSKYMWDNSEKTRKAKKELNDFYENSSTGKLHKLLATKVDKDPSVIEAKKNVDSARKAHEKQVDDMVKKILDSKGSLTYSEFSKFDKSLYDPEHHSHYKPYAEASWNRIVGDIVDGKNKDYDWDWDTGSIIKRK